MQNNERGEEVKGMENATESIITETARLVQIAREILTEPDHRPFLISCLKLQLRVMKEIQNDETSHLQLFEEIADLYRIMGPSAESVAHLYELSQLL